jgi:hypothetical protein
MPSAGRITAVTVHIDSPVPELSDVLHVTVKVNVAYRAD